MFESVQQICVHFPKEHETKTRLYRWVIEDAVWNEVYLELGLTKVRPVVGRSFSFWWCWMTSL